MTVIPALLLFYYVFSRCAMISLLTEAEAHARDHDQPGQALHWAGLYMTNLIPLLGEITFLASYPHDADRRHRDDTGS